MDLFVVLIVWHSDMNFNLGVGMEETIAAYLMWRRAARREIHTDASLALLGDLCNIVKALMLKNFKQFSPSKFKFRKFHDMDHAPLSIRMFGHLYNTSAQAEECEHQENTKSPWKLTNKRDAEMQMTKTIERREVLAYLVAMDPIQASKITTRKTKASQAPEAQWARARTRVLARTEEPLAPRHPYLLTGNNNYN